MNSPGVYSKETDLTFNVQSVTSNATGYVGLFTWGPANQVVPITTDETELVRRFGQPDNTTSMYFHSAANYLLYTTPLYVVRAVGDSAVNAMAADSIAAGEAAIVVYNDEDFEDVSPSIFQYLAPSFIGRYPGTLANSIKVSVADSTDYANWDYVDEFTYAPEAGEFNMVVIDEDGVITGTAGQILERYELMTKTAGAKKDDGTTAYVVEAIKNQSNYIFVVDEDSIDLATGIYEVSLEAGVDDNDSGTVDFQSAYDIFANSESVDVIRLFTSGAGVTGTIRAIDVVDGRKDAVCFHACELSDVYNNLDAATDVAEYFETTINKPTSYAFQVDNWKMVYDKYNDKNIWIPCDSDVAGLHSRLFVEAEAWYSPAGLNRGQLKNVIKLAWSADKATRDVLYKKSINSVISITGEGNVLFGDKTALRRPSAFQYINVRSLFIVIKKSISRAARYQLFEINDDITQSLFRNPTDRYLEDIKSRRGIYDKRVVCDSTNNTPQVIDAGEFVGDIYVKPARSINVIRLNFIAVGTGVDFEEIEG